MRASCDIARQQRGAELSACARRAVIHTDPHFVVTVGENCSLGHACVVHGATIEDGNATPAPTHCRAA